MLHSPTEINGLEVMDVLDVLYNVGDIYVKFICLCDDGKVHACEVEVPDDVDVSDLGFALWEEYGNPF